MEDTETEETLFDSAEVIDLAKRRPRHEGEPHTKNAGGKTIGDKYERIFKSVAKELAVTEAAKLTEQEHLFIDLVVGGASLSRAYIDAFPERSFELNADGKPNMAKPCLTNERAWDRGNKLANTLRVRAELRLRLEQEMADTEHTSLRLRNMRIKQLEHLALHGATDSVKLKALAMLRDEKALIPVDDQIADKQKTSQELLTEIDDLLKRASN